MQKWLLIALLVAQVHFAASYLVPLDAQSQGEFGGLLRWFWPWSRYSIANASAQSITVTR